MNIVRLRHRASSPIGTSGTTTKNNNGSSRNASPGVLVVMPPTARRGKPAAGTNRPVRPREHIQAQARRAVMQHAIPKRAHSRA